MTTIRERMSLGHPCLTLKVDVMTVGGMKSDGDKGLGDARRVE